MKNIKTNTEKSEEANEFGQFGEINVKNCFACGKTIRQRNCYGFVREKDKPKFTPTTTPTGTSYAITSPKSYICLKCLLCGVWDICKDRKKINEYLDLYIKTSLSEKI